MTLKKSSKINDLTEKHEVTYLEVKKNEVNIFSSKLLTPMFDAHISMFDVHSL